MNVDPSQLDPLHCYRLLVGSIVPRPIAWISTLSDLGVLNLAPYSFFTVASCNPPVLCVTHIRPRNRTAKDTLTNLLARGECVVNIVSDDRVREMNATSADYPPDTSEFAAVGIASEPSIRVAPEGVKNAPVRFECTLREVIDIAPNAMGGQLMLLNVVSIFVDDQLTSEGQLLPQQLQAVGKLGGDLYTTTRDKFELARPVL